MNAFTTVYLREALPKLSITDLQDLLDWCDQEIQRRKQQNAAAVVEMVPAEPRGVS